MGKTAIERNKEYAAVKCRAHGLMTKALVSIYTHKLKQSRIKKF